ncbi:tape measure protein [Mycobacterium phage Archie]|uniref:Tape measure protein n=1 Tax=Mycobacterium phage Archie TaxID=1718599 RepID=A0A0M4S2S3_9CAUD|nr:tail length tape measure protein [Mycobacterium phage Archie]ALF00322.1 tape measure protein [Mycobacterium phage Archie]
MAEYVAAQASVLMVPTLGKGANSFHQKLRTQLQTVRESVEVKVEAKTAEMLAEIEAAKQAAERDPIRLRIEEQSVTHQITSIKRKVTDLKDQTRRGLTLNIAVAGMAQLSQLSLLIGSVNTSLVQLAQSSLVVPGIMGGLASSLGTAIVGSRGLADAFKAQAQAAQSTVESARSQRDANNAVRDSTRALNNAIRDARRNIEDLNAQLRDAPLDEAEAMLNLQEAIAEAGDKAGKSAFQIQKDQVAQLRAESQLAETRRRNLRLQDDVQEANAKGIQGNDAVVAATERLTQALESAADGSTAMKKLADAMGNLSPNAQDFVNRVRSLSGAWLDLRTAVQDRLFADLGSDIQGLAGTGLPLLERGLTGIAGAINGNLRAAIAQLGDSQNQGLLERLFGNTEDAQNLLTRAVDPLIGGVLRLTAASSDSLPRLSDAFGDVMTRFENFVTAADDDGRLDKWIDSGLKALTDLGNTLLNIGSIMNSVSEAFTGTGGRGLLDLLSDGTKRLADFLKSAEGQQKLKDIFYEARAEFQKWRPTLEQIPGILKNVQDAAQRWANMLLPFLNTAATLLKEHPGLIQTILFAWLGWRTIQPILTGIRSGLDLMRGGLDLVSKAFGNGDGGVNGKASKFSGLMAVGGPIALGVSAVASVLMYEYVNAQQEAAESTAYHADMVARLRNEMDALSGSLTQQGLTEKLGRAGGFVDPNETDAKPRDLPGLAQSEFNINRELFGQALTPTNQAARDQVIGTTRKAILDELNSKPLAEFVGEDDANFLDLLNKQRKPEDQITTDVLARALTGDAQARELFEKSGASFSLSDLLYGYNSPLSWLPGSRNDDTPGLSQRARAGANISRFVMDDTNHALQVGSEIRSNNEAVTGRAQFKQGAPNPFAGLGSPSAYYEPGGQGAAGIRVDMPFSEIKRNHPDLVENIRKNGGRFEELADGTVIHLDADRAGLYLQPAPTAATGGLFSGPGTGRSDSILARVSNGEFITRADAVAKYGQDFFHALNKGEVDPALLPGFDGGGMIFAGPYDPPPAPKPDFAGVTASGAAALPPPVVRGLPDTGVSVPLTPGAQSAKDAADNFGTPKRLPDSGLTLPVRKPQLRPGISQWFGGLFGSDKPAAPVREAPPGASADFVDRMFGLATAGAAIPMSDPANPTLYDPATGKFAGPAPAPRFPQKPATPLKAGRDGDKGEASGPNVPPTDPRSPGYAQPNHALVATHGGGGSPGPGNGIPHLTGAAPGPGLTPTVAGLPGLGLTPQPGMPGSVPNPGLTPSANDPLGLSGLPDELQPVSIFEQIGEILLSAVLGFFGIDPTYFGIGKRIFTGLTGKDKDDRGKPKDADPQVQQIIDGYPTDLGTQYPFVGALNGTGSPAAQRAANMAEVMAGKPYVWGGSGLDGTDCSGLVMYVADALNGKPFSGRTGGTGGFAQSIPAKGGVIISDPSQAPPGTYRIGWNASHTAATLPDGRNIESSTYGKPIAVGSGASGYNDPQFTNWAYFPLPSYASGGFLSGAGTGRSDSMLARVSNGEFITRADSVAKYGRGFMEALNAGRVDPSALPGFAPGGMPLPPPTPLPTPPAAEPPPVATAEPNGAPPPSDPAALAPPPAEAIPTETAEQALGGLGSALSGTGAGSSGQMPGAAAPEGATPGVDPRSVAGRAPTNLDHNNPALTKGIQSGFTHVGSLIATAASMGAGAAGAAGAPGAGAAGGAAGAGIQAGAQIAGQVASGAVNILSSLLVGTLSGGSSPNAYGAPVLPQQPQGSGLGGPAVVNNYGDIHTASYDQFYQGQQRREAQTQVPFLPMK